MLPPARCSPTTSPVANAIGPGGQCPRTCSFQVGAIGWMAGKFTGHSMPSRDGSGCAVPATVMDRGCMISVTCSPRLRWSIGIDLTKNLSGASLF